MSRDRNTPRRGVPGLRQRPGGRSGPVIRLPPEQWARLRDLTEDYVTMVKGRCHGNTAAARIMKETHDMADKNPGQTGSNTKVGESSDAGKVEKTSDKAFQQGKDAAQDGDARLNEGAHRDFTDRLNERS